ncbi:dnaJ homolog subfamily C member 30 [Orussus abietinus]|uniref:dnaJ homolog subfamily C member 30 n=1 Tax=Orussus abietinus TaxID=222816 RepID=UPI000626C69F|nr:dnaJ homolog subfamily C member 30 [Orussus abietinus]XP_012288021.1 dnaJ homolog subfamily C member 30 [Orussus abietinus]
MMSFRLGPWWTTCTRTMSNRSFIPKGQTHYETLEVKRSATQDQIKAAYYKLTMKYHPDRNKSESAKQKFRDVADAYNILGNYTSRKKYDRGTLVTAYQKDLKHDAEIKSEHPHQRFYQSRMSTNEHTAKNEKKDSHNFETWTHDHYEKLFAQRMELKAKRDLKDKMKESDDQVSVKVVITVACICLIIIGVGMFTRQISDTDKVYVRTKDTDSLDKNTVSVEDTK